MKRRGLFVTLFLLLACLCSTPAFAAVESGGVRYLWYTQDGRQTWENGQVTAFSGERFFLSADGGATYAEFPEFQAASREGWTDYDVRVTALDAGGLRVEARSTFGEAGAPYTQRWDYTAGELSQILSRAESNPVTVLADNGSLRVGVHTIYDYRNSDETQAPNYSAWRQQNWEEELVWSADGANWSRCQYPQDFDCPYGMTGWWDGAFYLRKDNDTPDGYTSPDGVSWTYLAELPISLQLALTADWGPYHFEVVCPADGNQWYHEVYLMAGNERNEGVLLPHMGEGIRAQGMGVESLTAVSGPNGTVTLTVSGYPGSFSLDYPTASLDWCLENLSTPFRWETELAASAFHNGVTLAKVAEHYRNANVYEQEGELLRDDGTGWKKVENTPFSCVFRLLPWNGKTFLVEDNATGRHRLYASEDGLSWTEVTALRPQDMEGHVKDYVNYAMAWTESGYLACREAGYYGNRAGGRLYEGNTSVYLLDEDFSLVGAHDFGRLVQAVGYLDGVYYAQVSDSEGTKWRGVYHVGYDENGNEIYDTEEGYYNKYAPSTLYRSTDGETWEPTELLQMEDVLQQGIGDAAILGVAREGASGPEGAADLEGYHFYLGNEKAPVDAESMGWRDTILVTDENGRGGPIPEAWKAIRNAWLTPGFLTVRRDASGKVELTVEDLFSPELKAVVRCTTAELDELIAAGEEQWDYLRLGDVFATHSDQTWLALHGTSGNDYGQRVNQELIWSRVGGDGDYSYSSNTLDCTLGRLHVAKDVPWSGYILLHPYNGKTFLIYDRSSGDFYAAEDGLNWKKLEADWIDDHRAFFAARQDGRLRYHLAWTGDGYIMSCHLFALNADTWEYEWHPDNTKVFFLDETFQPVSSHDFGRFVGAVGFREGFYYADVATSAEDTYERTLLRSADGQTWEPVETLDPELVLQSVQ
ncbi:MAG: hypothetical protein HFF05_06055 [Oscillospiraceae bacterium]|nr:hypothetical protein [Oscillospiraceae bacterium]